MPKKYENSCKYLRIWKDGLCNLPCSGEYCAIHNRLVKRHNNVSPSCCSNCKNRGTWAGNGICNKCTTNAGYLNEQRKCK